MKHERNITGISNSDGDDDDYFDNISTYIKIYQYWAYPEFHEKTGFENGFLHE